MQGAFQHRSGRVISLSRFALASVFLLAIWLDPSQPSHYEVEAYAILAAYVLAAAIYLAATWNDWWLEHRLAAAAHVVDIASFAVMVFLTEGYTSPFFTFFVFIILSATIKWGWRETALTAAAVVLVFFATGMAALNWGAGEFELQRLVFRSTYLVVLSLVLIWFGINQAGARGDRSQTPRLVDATQHSELPVRPALDLVASQTRARRIVFAWWDKEEPWIEIALLENGAFRTERHGPESFGEIVSIAPEGRAFLFDQPRKRALIQREGKSAEPSAGQEPIAPRFAERFGIEAGLAIPVDSESYGGVMFALDAAGLFSDDFAAAEKMAFEIAAAMDHAAGMVVAQEATVARTRLALARDLHDSVVQLLAGTSFRLAGIKKSLGSGHDVVLDIDALQQELAVEQRDIRSLIGQLRTHTAPNRKADLHMMLSQLADRLARQWGIACKLVRCPNNFTASPRMQHDVQQIVRESVSNAVRHGKATEVSLSADTGEHGLSLIVADNGSGFAMRNGDSADAGIERPWSLNERVRDLGGTLSLYSSCAGSRITISLPFEGRL